MALAVIDVASHHRWTEQSDTQLLLEKKADLESLLSIVKSHSVAHEARKLLSIIDKEISVREDVTYARLVFKKRHLH